MKTILITGCAGFIGSHLTDFFLKKNYNIIGIDNFFTGNLDNIKHLEKTDQFKFINHDICKSIKIDDDIDYILHFASPASPVDYLRYPIKTLQIGSIGAEKILKLGLKKKATVLVASTSEVYGDPLEHPQSESYFGNVNPVGPRAVYDEAKRYMEAISMAYHKKKKLDIRIARIFNTYGPRMRKNDGRAIPSFINQALNNEDYTVFGTGKQTRSFCYVSDLVNGIYKLLKTDYKNPVNLGNPNEKSILELIKILNKLIKNDNKLNYLKLPENDPKIRQPDIKLAKEILKWYPKVSLEDGLKKTIMYYK